jgi:hypothetical protein
MSRRTRAAAIHGVWFRGEVRVSIPGVREDALRTAGRACAEEDSGKESLHGEWLVPVRLVNAVAVASSSA